MANIKLYRGLKEASFHIADPKLFERHRAAWRQILLHRQKSAEYPPHLNKLITQTHRENKLLRQSFSDNRETAQRYAAGGVLVEINVPIDDILRHFELEIQNYGKRKQRFEIVYAIDALLLAKHLEAWGCRVTPI